MSIIIETIAAAVVVISAIILGAMWIIEAIRYAEKRIQEEEYESRSERRERYYSSNTRRR